MTISKKQAADIMDELKPLIEDALKRHGLDAPKLSWKYGAWFELKMTASELDEGVNGVNMSSPEAQYYSRFGFSAFINHVAVKLEAPLGTKFYNQGNDYVFLGIAAKRSKYPIAARRVDDDQLVFFPEGIVTKINAAASTAAV